MNSFILIDGVALWVILGFVAFFAIDYIIVACAYLKSIRENAQQKEIIKQLRKDNNELLGAYLDAACEVDENV